MQLGEAGINFMSYLRTQKRVAYNTIQAYQSDLRQFLTLCAQNKITSTDDLTTSTGNGFVSFLKKDCALSARSIARKVACIRAFFRFLVDHNLAQPTTLSIIVPKQRQTIPKVLARERIEQLFKQLQVANDPTSERNRLIFYLLYGTGMRVSEIAQLRLSDLHLDEQLIRIHGKGSKERLLPIGTGLVKLVRIYLDQAREYFLPKQATSEALFPVKRGEGVYVLTRQAVWRVLHDLGKRMGYRLTPHMLRHTMATHLLHNGVDLRSVQVLLGHEHVTTTQIYTHVDVHQLRAVYDKVHGRR